MPAVPIQTLAIVAPTISAQAIFSGRRAKKGMENMDNDPLFGILNFDIALGQFLKGARAVKAASKIVNNGASGLIEQASKAASELGKTSKVAKTFGNILDFTAYHINPIIWAAAIVKGLNNDDEESKSVSLARELAPVGVMRIAEEIYCDQMGMPITKKLQNGEQVNHRRIGKLFSKKQIEALSDVVQVKNLSRSRLAATGGTLKGLGFVAASIAGYKAGEIITDKVLGKRPNKNENEAKTEN